MEHRQALRSPRGRAVLASGLAAAALTAGLQVAPTAQAYNSVGTGGGDQWNVNDAAIPGLDTGSVRDTTASALQGYGGVRLKVINGDDRLNGALMRGFGLTFDGRDSFESARAVVIDGVAVKRELKIDQEESYGRFLDTFTNTSKQPQEIEVAFGGQVGYDTGTNQSDVADTSDGDDEVTSADGWVSFYTPSDGPGSASANGPSATTIGTPGYAGSLDRVGIFLRDPFVNDLPETGDEANHPGFVNTITLAPGESRSVVHFVVTGLSETSGAPDGSGVPAAGSQVAAVEAKAAELTAAPDLAGMTVPEICSLANYDVSALPGFDASDCDGLSGEPLAGAVRGAVAAPEVKTTSPYDVVGKSITDLVADMESGTTNAQQIVRAYLDRIAAYDQGPLGLHSVLAVAPDAMQQARAADRAREAGDDRPLLGIPIMIKDIIDTEDMPTTGGSLIFDGYQPTSDAWQVAKLREAGAIILGKANLSEFANSGYYSESAFGQVWGAFDPSRSPIGSSGGSAVAVASAFAAAAMGTQTGDSLWGPSGAASLYSLRGTDGMQSSAGTMPLTVVQDYVGHMAQSLDDLALLLNASAVGNPDDPLDDISDGHRPDDWTAALDPDALEGARIGIPETVFDDPFGTTVVSDALRAQFAYFEQAGATLVPMDDYPGRPDRTYSGDTNYEGWRRWIAEHPDNPYTDPVEIIRSPLRIPFRRNTSPYTGSGAMSEQDIADMEDWRATYRASVGTWMDEFDVDAVLYATELSDIHLNDSIHPSFGRINPNSSYAGVPSVVFPAGLNAHDQPVGFQLEGKEFDDAKILGYAYAFDQLADGHVVSTSAPALEYDADAIPEPVDDLEPLPDAEVRTLTVLDRTEVANRAARRFTLDIGCASAAGRCAGDVTVKWSGRTLLDKTVKVRAGGVKKVGVKLKPAARRKLEKGRSISVKVLLVGTGKTQTAEPVRVKVRPRG